MYFFLIALQKLLDSRFELPFTATRIYTTITIIDLMPEIT